MDKLTLTNEDMEKSTEYPSKLKGKDYVDRVFTREAVEQILNARVKPVNEDRIKEIINNHLHIHIGINISDCAHALAVEFAVPTCDHEPLDKLTSLKQRIDGITVEEIAKITYEGYSKGKTHKQIAVAIHDKIKGVRI